MEKYKVGFDGLNRHMKEKIYDELKKRDDIEIVGVVNPDYFPCELDVPVYLHFSQLIDKVDAIVYKAYSSIDLMRKVRQTRDAMVALVSAEELMGRLDSLLRNRQS